MESGWQILSVIITVLIFSYGVASLVFKWKIREYHKEAELMTKTEFEKKCNEKQNACPQMEDINIQLTKILDYSKANSTHTKHIAECFLLYLSQTTIDEGIKEYIEEKLKQQVGLPK